jgi:hypothetical protein
LVRGVCRLRKNCRIYGGPGVRRRDAVGVPERGFPPNDHSRERAWGETHARGRKVPTDATRRDEWGETFTGDAAVAALAARQQGMVTTRQLAAAGIGESAVAHRVANGRLTRIFRGVYRVGPRDRAVRARNGGRARDRRGA